MKVARTGDKVSGREFKSILDQISLSYDICSPLALSRCATMADSVTLTRCDTLPLH